MGMLTLRDRIQYRERTTVAGVCRASFSTWANDNGISPPGRDRAWPGARAKPTKCESGLQPGFIHA